MRCKLHVLGKFGFSGDVLSDPRLSILVDPYVQCMLRYSSVPFYVLPYDVGRQGILIYKVYVSL